MIKTHRHSIRTGPYTKPGLGAAERGRTATVRRESTTAAVVDADRLRRFVAAVSPVRARVVSEAGGWSVFIPGLPIAVDGATFDEAISEVVEALREYAADWCPTTRFGP